MGKSINLGRKWDAGIPVSVNDVMGETHYPDIYISDVDDPRLLDMPDEGEATIKFKVVSRTHNEHENPDGKKERSCSIRLEVHSIEPPEKTKKKNGTYGSDARKSFSDYFKDR